MADPVRELERGDLAADVVAFARDLISTPSVNPALEDSGTGEAAVAELTAGWLRTWGYDVRMVEAPPGRPSVLARLGLGSAPSLILCGHLDTVGVDGMIVDPFAAEVRDGRLWGRGAADMKGGVAALLAAARDAAERGVGGQLLIALTADEEEAGAGCLRLIEEGLHADAAVVCEPTGLAVMPAHKGFVWIRIAFRGQAAHGSRPDRGVDAIRHAGLFLARLDALEAELSKRPPHPLLGYGSIHAGTVAGGTAPSVYPSSCELTLERRILPGETIAAVRSEVEYLLAQLRSGIPDLHADVDVVLHRNGSEVPSDHELVRAVRDAARKAGAESEVAGMTAWVEAVVFNEAGIPAVCFGPGSIEDAHSADESVAIDELRTAHRALSILVEELLE
jgi:acetylornithine deacetylase